VGRQCRYVLKDAGIIRLAVNFINTLRVHFLYKIWVPKITKLKRWHCNFWHQNISKKCARKTLMKWTLGFKLTWCTIVSLIHLKLRNGKQKNFLQIFSLWVNCHNTWYLSSYSNWIQIATFFFFDQCQQFPEPMLFKFFCLKNIILRCRKASISIYRMHTHKLMHVKLINMVMIYIVNQGCHIYHNGVKW